MTTYGGLLLIILDRHTHRDRLQCSVLFPLRAKAGQRFRPVGIVNPLAQRIESCQEKTATWPLPVHLMRDCDLDEPTWIFAR